MRIGLDFRLLSAGGLTLNRGTGRYTQQQLCEVLRLGGDHEVVLFCREDADLGALRPEIATSPRVFVASLPALAGRAWHELNAPSEVLRATAELQRSVDAQELDVFHWTIPCRLDDLVARPLDAATVATHYDLIPWLFPSQYLKEPSIRRLYERSLELLRRADRLLAISPHARREAASRLEIPWARIRVASPIADAVFGPLAEAERERRLVPLRRRLEVPAEFVLTVSHLHHTKNLRGLFAAWRLLSPELRRRLPLVLACELGDAERRRLEREAERHGLAEDLRLTGFVSDDELAALYNAATLVVHPSLYEGFGLPVLEAMRCGAAVLAADSAALPEVVGEGGVLFDPEDAAALAREIEALSGDEAARKALGAQARAQAQTFRGEDLGRQTLAAYAEAAEALHERRRRRHHRCRQGRPRLAFWSPVPPQESGIADYSLELLRATVGWAEVEVFVDDGVMPGAEVTELVEVWPFTEACRRHRRNPFDATLAQLGSSFFHLYMRAALEAGDGPPLILTLHDLAWGALLRREAALMRDEGAFRHALELEGERASEEYDEVLKRREPKQLEAALEGFLNRRWLLGAAIRASAAQIVHLPGYGAELESRYPNARVHEVPMGVDDPRRSRESGGAGALRSRLGIPSQAFLIGAFGVAHPVKRLEAVTTAVARLTEELPGCDPCLIVVGAFADPAYRARLERLAAELGMTSRVRLVGRVSRRDFDAALLACDVVVNLRFPFRHQMSAILLRAAAAAVPFVVSEVEGWRFLPDSFCLRAPVSDCEVERLTEHLSWLAREPEQRRASAEAARRYWLEHGTVAQMAAGYREVLSQVLGRQIDEGTGK